MTATAPLVDPQSATPASAVGAAARVLVDRLVRRASSSPGTVARLKRGAGKNLSDPDLRGETATEFYRLLPRNVPSRAMDACFLVSTLFPLTKRDSPRFGNIGASLRFCRNKANAPGLDRRVEALLDADEAQLPYRLRRVVQYAAGRDTPAPINWARLVQDVAAWHWPDTRARV